ncbi:hypothetical protein MST27_17255 [Pseudomonas sp. PS1]|uniref:Uncharacterized protein n=1 Tax=Stutzerimonas marianensis TaxID=2929513 RepID=A0A9X2AT08_9GAMM|nr:hypothetical protein [Pseudomonas marianensis]
MNLLMLDVKAAEEEAVAVSAAATSPVTTIPLKIVARAMERTSARGAPNTLIDIESLRNLILQKAGAFKKVAGGLFKSFRRLLGEISLCAAGRTAWQKTPDCLGGEPGNPLRGAFIIGLKKNSKFF